jgi:hypothetical protein
VLERDRELVEHQPVDFTHLFDRQPRNRVGSDRWKGQVGAGVSARTALFRGPVALELHAESVGDAIDVVEVGDDLVRVDDRAVVESVRAQPLEVLLDDLRRCECQFAGVLEQRGEPRTVFLDVSGDDRLRQRSVT